MSKKYTTNFLEDTNGSTGSANQVLVSTAAGIDWVDGSGSGIIGGPYLPLSAGSGSPLTGTLYGTSTNFSGNGDYAGSMTLGTGVSTAEANLQIGQGRTGNGYSYIDLIGDATYTDYGLRIIRNNAGANTSSAIMHRGTGNLEISSVESSSTLFKTNSTTALTLTNTQNAIFTGNVGIGTTAPAAKLHVKEPSGSTSQIKMSASSNEANYGYLTMTDNTVNTAKLTFGTTYGYNTPVPAMTVWNGMIGIGTTSPSDKLEVVGNIRLRQSLSNTETVYISTNARGGGTADADLRLGNSISGDVLTVHNSSVGIGTTSPSQKLDVRDGTITSRDSGNVNYAELDRFAGLTLKGNGAGAKYVSTPNTDALGFKTNNSEKMRITSSGNVGIGTTSPDSILQVGDPMETNTLTIAGLYSAGGARLNFRSGHPSNSTVWNMGEIKVTDDGNYNGRIEFQTTASGGNVGASPTTKMVLKANGNVGIGTTNPAGTLSVENTGTAGVPVLDIINTSASMFNHSAEIMTPNMTTGQNNIFVIGRAGSTKNSGYIGYKYSGTAGANANVLTFGHWGSDNLMNIDGLGNVGIGTTSPEAKLNILSTGIDDEALVVQDNGRKIKIGRDSIKVTDLSNAVANMYLQGDGSNVILPNAVSRLGIGTTNPGEKLEVLGNVKAETLIATDLTDGYVPYSKSGTLGLQDSKIYTQGAGIGVGTTTLAAGCHITSLSNISATGYRVSAMQTAPSSRGDTGTLGEIRITADYIYVCYATNSWRRVAIAQW